jgi:hypothetical protein
MQSLLHSARGPFRMRSPAAAAAGAHHFFRAASPSPQQRVVTRLSASSSNTTTAEPTAATTPFVLLAHVKVHEALLDEHMAFARKIDNIVKQTERGML